jgi:hypothetical protein
VTNKAAIILAGVIILALLLDQVANDGIAALFLVRKVLDLVEYMAFWR